ncbi:hypothetical protein D9757_006070 [Collybiopsis confluens]|uniref:Uncharacterized protein n=1 Tax=Collybiopsis confluens TaxID=2823264 RepID=A0A8H5M6T7_9AGAR|nr:hypothetical protein D9757_006070 [Collybiopsis confluens]
MSQSPMISSAFTEGLTNFVRIGNYSDLRCFALHDSLPANEQPSILGCTIPIYASSLGGAKLHKFKTTHKPYIWDRYDVDADGSDVKTLEDNEVNDDAIVVEEEEPEKYSSTFELSNCYNQGISLESLTKMYRYLELAIKTLGWTAREVFEFFINPKYSQSSTGDRVSLPHTILFQHLRPMPADSLDDAEWIIAFKSPVAEDVFKDQLKSKQTMEWAARLLDAMAQLNSLSAPALCGSVFNGMAARSYPITLP